MSSLDKIDIQASLASAVTEIFSTMLEMDVTTENGLTAPPTGNRIVGTVSFAGDVMGSLNIHVGMAFAQLMTANMLGMDVSEIESEEEVQDVVGELSNMVGGDLKSRFVDANFPCKLSIPTITKGADFAIETKDFDRHDGISVSFEDHHALVEVYIKAEG